MKVRKPLEIKLEGLIQSIINITSNETGVSMDLDEQDRMTRGLRIFVLSAIDKYIEGKREHGGDLLDRSLFKEFKNEHIDMFFYMLAAEEKQRKLLQMLSDNNN